jgi:hypothetical protein
MKISFLKFVAIFPFVICKIINHSLLYKEQIDRFDTLKKVRIPFKDSKIATKIKCIVFFISFFLITEMFYKQCFRQLISLLQTLTKILYFRLYTLERSPSKNTPFLRIESCTKPYKDEKINKQPEKI